jgi:hypothetical protein
VSANRLFKDSVNPHHKRGTMLEKGVACLCCRADEVRDSKAPGLDYLTAQPSRAVGMLGAVCSIESQLLTHMLAHLVGIEVRRVEARGQRPLPAWSCQRPAGP